MEMFLAIITVVLLILAIIGCVLPAIPGPVLAYGAMWIIYTTSFCDFTLNYMLILGLVTAVVFFADYFLPPLIAKKFGGSNYAAWGSIVGMIIGMFIPPIGLLIGMLLGAFIGEFAFAKRSGSESIIATIGTLLGFVVGTGMKLLLCFYMLYEVIFTIAIGIKEMF